MRFEFLDTIIRLALAKYRKTKTTDNSWDACQMLMDLNLPRVSDVLKCDPNEFRSQELCVAPASHYVRSAAGLTGSRMCVAGTGSGACAGCSSPWRLACTNLTLTRKIVCTLALFISGMLFRQWFSVSDVL